MKSRFSTLGLLLFAAFVIGLSLWAFVAPGASTDPSQALAQVIIIRHGEKPEFGAELSERGKERAAALAPFFQGRPDVLRFGPPVAIYAERPKKGTSSVRPIDTVQPLAESLGIPVNEDYTRDELQPLAQAIRANRGYAGKMVLVCWEHEMIPEIAHAFGATQAPAKWPGNAFDRLWIITFEPDGRVTFQDLPQQLLFGDSPM